MSNGRIVAHSKGMAVASKMLWKKYLSQRVVKYYISVCGKEAEGSIRGVVHMIQFSSSQKAFSPSVAQH